MSKITQQVSGRAKTRNRHLSSSPGLFLDIILSTPIRVFSPQSSLPYPDLPPDTQPRLSPFLPLLTLQQGHSFTSIQLQWLSISEKVIKPNPSILHTLPQTTHIYQNPATDIQFTHSSQCLIPSCQVGCPLPRAGRCLLLFLLLFLLLLLYNCSG